MDFVIQSGMVPGGTDILLYPVIFLAAGELRTLRDRFRKTALSAEYECISCPGINLSRS